MVDAMDGGDLSSGDGFGHQKGENPGIRGVAQRSAELAELGKINVCAARAALCCASHAGKSGETCVGLGLGS